MLDTMEKKDTVAAISTAQAPGGIGVVRISGPRARQVGDRVFRSAKGKTIRETPGYTALYGGVYDGEEKIGEYPLVADGDVNKASFGELVSRFFDGLF